MPILILGTDVLERRKEMLMTIILPLAALSHFQVGVKSVPHWEHTKAGAGLGGSASRLRILVTHSSRPHR